MREDAATGEWRFESTIPPDGACVPGLLTVYRKVRLQNMKKNLLSILILGLLIVNIVLTTIMMVSVIGTNSKTGELVSSIAAVMNLEYYDPDGEASGGVPLSQTATYSLADRLMIQLKPSVDENGNAGASMIIFYMSLAMDTENKDYEALGQPETLAGLEIQIKDTVASVVQDYTEQECRENFEQIKAEILIALQDLFQSNFIYKVSISDVLYQ